MLSIKYIGCVKNNFTCISSINSSKITQKKNSETDTQVQTTQLKISILKNTPTNWRLLHRNFSDDT